MVARGTSRPESPAALVSLLSRMGLSVIVCPSIYFARTKSRRSSKPSDVARADRKWKAPLRQQATLSLGRAFLQHGDQAVGVVDDALSMMVTASRVRCCSRAASPAPGHRAHTGPPGWRVRRPPAPRPADGTGRNPGCYQPITLFELSAWGWRRRE